MIADVALKSSVNGDMNTGSRGATEILVDEQRDGVG